MKRGLFQAGVEPYPERSEHRQRQTSVSRLRQVTAHRRTSSPSSGMNDGDSHHELKEGLGHTWSEANYRDPLGVGELEFRFGGGRFFDSWTEISKVHFKSSRIANT